MIDLNYAAITAAAIAAFVTSSVWYAVFDPGRASDAASGREVDGTAPASQTGRPPAWKIGAELARSLIVATVVAALARLVGVDHPVAAAGLALALWAAFPFVLLSGSVLWEGVRPRAAAVHAGDWLAKLLVVATIVSVWR